MVTRTEKEIYDQIDKANENIESGDGFHGMSYEDGVKAALEWVLGMDDAPME